MEGLGAAHELPRPVSALRVYVNRLSCCSICIEHMLLEAGRVTRQDGPRNCALSEDVRAWSKPRRIVEGSGIEDLY